MNGRKTQLQRSSGAAIDLQHVSLSSTPTEGRLGALRRPNDRFGHVRHFTRSNDRLRLITRQDAPTVGVKGAG